MELELVGGHVSFPDKLHERRIVLLPNADVIHNLSQKICSVYFGVKQFVQTHGSHFTHLSTMLDYVCVSVCMVMGH